MSDGMTTPSRGLTEEECLWVTCLRDAVGVSTPLSTMLVSLVDSLRVERVRAERAEAVMAQFGAQAAEAQQKYAAWNGHVLTLGIIAGFPEGQFPIDTTDENIRERALAKVTQLREIAEAVERVATLDARSKARLLAQDILDAARWRSGRGG